MKTTLEIVSVVAITAMAAQIAAATEIGSFVGIRGTVEVRRASAGDWKVVTVGAPVYVSDEIRTGPKGRAKLFFRDAAVVDLGRSSALSVKRFDQSSNDNVLSLSAGRLRAFLSEAGRAAEATFEVDTPTAVVRAESTVFVVEYSAEEKSTRIYGIEGVVDVQGSIGLIGPSLKVGAQQQTVVQDGKFPEPAQPTDADAIAAMTAELEIIGTGRGDGFAATHPILKGAVTRSDEKPEAVRVGSTASAAMPSDSVSYLRAQVPGETLVERLSPAVRANSQPIPEYEFARPDRVPPSTD